MKDKRDLLSTMSVWIRLPGLSFNLWGNLTISALVSTIGVPIKMDDATKNRTRISLAHVLVDMKTEVGFPNFIEVEEDGNVFSQEVIYKNAPSRCDNCCWLGYFNNQFPMLKTWVPKQKDKWWRWSLLFVRLRSRRR